MGSFFTSLLLAFAAAPVFAAPDPNATKFELTFVHEPNGRGTISILLSCFITLGLCVWTAVHCDIIPNSTDCERLFHKLTWMVVAFIVPELLISYSFNQWHSARQVHRSWCKHHNIGPGSTEDTLGVEGAFFAVMGGCTMEDAAPGNTTYILTPRAFIDFTRTGVISPAAINKKIIINKGKADSLAKLLVCVQASWVMAEYVSRKAMGLPVTLLELHVVMQVACVIMMYGFWWYKPLDVTRRYSSSPMDNS